MEEFFSSFLRRAGMSATELTASRQRGQVCRLSSQGEFVLIAVESHDPINRDALQFLTELAVHVERFCFCQGSCDSDTCCRVLGVSVTVCRTTA